MPQTIYMPQDPSAIGNVIAPAANQMSQFLWNLAGMKIKANFDAQVADTQARALEAKEKRDFARQKELIGVRGKEGRKTAIASKLGDTRTYKQGDEFVTEEFTAGGWAEKATAGRYKPKDVNVNVNTGDMTKATKTTIEKGLIDVQKSLGRTGNIIKSYKRRYMDVPNRMANKWTAAKEKFKVGKPPSMADKKELSEYTSFRAGAIASVNQEIHDLTGAQMSRWEAKRLMAGMPNPGKGLFDGDSATEFEAKLLNTYKGLLQTQARYMWYLNKKGLSEGETNNLINSGKAIPLSQIMGEIDQRGLEVERELLQKQPELEGTDDLKSKVKQILKSEFGWEF